MDHIRDMAAHGYNVSEIALETGRSEEYIRELIAEHHLDHHN